MKVYERTHPDEWTVVEIDDVDGDIQEIVFNCQGILQASDLPPMQGGRYVDTYNKNQYIIKI